jgi:hypothetical protein
MYQEVKEELRGSFHHHSFPLLIGMSARYRLPEKQTKFCVRSNAAKLNWHSSVLQS